MPWQGFSKLNVSIVLHASDSSISPARGSSFYITFYIKGGNILGNLGEEFLLDAAEVFPNFFACLLFDISSLKGGDRMSNLQQEIRGDMIEVARRRGFGAGITETHRKYLHPHVKSSFSPHLQRIFCLESYFFLHI